MLHIIHRSPFESHSLVRCLQIIQTGDAILFVENGVYALLLNTEPAKLLEQTQDLHFYALASDILARGLDKQITLSVSQIDYAGFVDLTIQHHPIQSWM